MKTLNQIEPRTMISELPYVITNRGSYYLTQNLKDTLGTNGITIASDDVTLDLNGFTLNGSPSSIDGITMSSEAPSYMNIVIRNGVVRGWGHEGVALQNGINCKLIGISAVECGANAGMGIYVGSDWTLDDCLAYNNYGMGISIGDNCRVRNCKVRKNRANGMYSGIGCVVEDCSATENNGDGFFGQTLSKIASCVAIGNTNNGIYVGPNSLATGNLCGQNGGNGISSGGGARIERNLCNNNRGNGILAGGESMIEQNQVSANTGAGIHGGWGCRVQNNHATFNGRGYEADAGARGTLFTGNSAVDAVSNYMNQGQSGFGDIADTNRLGDSFIFSNPWGNFNLHY